MINLLMKTKIKEPTRAFGWKTRWITQHVLDEKRVQRSNKKWAIPMSISKGGWVFHGHIAKTSW